MIDPLLAKAINTMYPPPSTPAEPAPSEASAPTPAPVVQKRASVPMRKKHPALSARILAVGLSTTAFLGMTSGYTLAQREPASQPISQEPSIANTANTVSENNSGQVTAMANAPIAATNAPVATNSTQVIQVPVPVAVPETATAATPGTTTAPAYQPAQTQQKSSGSN